MSGLIERLRSPQFADVAEKYLMIEAADALEANEKEIKRLGMLVGDTIADHPYVVELMRQLKEQDAEIERLRAALEEIEANTDDTELTPAFMRAIARKALEEK